MYCRTAFIRQEKFREDVTHRHGMPDFTSKGYNGPHPLQSSIRGNLKIVQLPINGDEVDLLEYLNNRKAIVDVKTNASPMKLRLSAGIQMIKDIHSDGEETSLSPPSDGEEKKIDIWANS